MRLVEVLFLFERGRQHIPRLWDCIDSFYQQNFSGKHRVRKQRNLSTRVVTSANKK